MGLLDRTLARSVELLPRALVKRVASRYVAGETLEDALAVSRDLNRQGCMVTLDLLGEAITREEEAEEVTTTCLSILEAIGREGIDGNLSVKPTAVGLATSEDLLEANLRRILDRARDLGNFVRVDMEDSPTTDATLRVYRRLREAGYENVGCVLQAMLHRTPADLADLEALRPNIRLCKGVYREPPEIAHGERDAVNAAYLALLDRYLSREDVYLALATHDDPLIEGAEARISSQGLPRERYEFQMLLGVRPEVREALVARGHRLRVYVPYGTAWYAYSVRRLRENPKFAGYITKDVLRNPKLLLGEGEGR